MKGVFCSTEPIDQSVIGIEHMPSMSSICDIHVDISEVLHLHVKRVPLSDDTSNRETLNLKSCKNLIPLDWNLSGVHYTGLYWGSQLSRSKSFNSPYNVCILDTIIPIKPSKNQLAEPLNDNGFAGKHPLVW